MIVVFEASATVERTMSKQNKYTMEFYYFLMLISLITSPYVPAFVR